MQISRIYSPMYNINYLPLKRDNAQNTPCKIDSNYSKFFNAYPNNYYLSFGERVKKDLPSFLERNSNYLPERFKIYTDSLDDIQKSTMTPLEALRNAYELLEICESIQDIKDAYPEEPLFKNLRSVSETKAPKGILHEARIFEDDLKKVNEGVLNNKEDLTVYLIKKIFLEAKTFEEINEDLDNDINPLFKKKDKNYIYHNTLNSLNIMFPRSEFLNSLRYTRENYSDEIGKILSDKWNNLTDGEKQERIQKIIDGKNNISDEKKEELKKLKSSLMIKRWQSLNPNEKVAYIEKMQTGNKIQRLAMIDAWNKSPELREKLSEYLINNNYYNPQNIIYRDQPFSEAMSKIMLAFWAENKSLSTEFGKILTNSYEKLKSLEGKSEYNTLEAEILQKQKEIKTNYKEKRIKDKKTQAKANSKKPTEFTSKDNSDNSINEYCVNKREEFIKKLKDKYDFLPEDFCNKITDMYVKKMSSSKNLVEFTPSIESEINELYKDLPNEYNSLIAAMYDTVNFLSTNNYQYLVIRNNIFVNSTEKFFNEAFSAFKEVQLMMNPQAQYKFNDLFEFFYKRNKSPLNKTQKAILYKTFTHGIKSNEQGLKYKKEIKDRLDNVTQIASIILDRSQDRLRRVQVAYALFGKIDYPEGSEEIITKNLAQL